MWRRTRKKSRNVTFNEWGSVVLRSRPGEARGTSGKPHSGRTKRGDGAVDQCGHIRQHVVTGGELVPVGHQPRHGRQVLQRIGTDRVMPRCVVGVRAGGVVPLQLRAQQKPHRSPQSHGVRIAEAELVGRGNELFGEDQWRDSDACALSKKIGHPGDRRQLSEDLCGLVEHPGARVAAVNRPVDVRRHLGDHHRQQRRLVGYVVVERHGLEVKLCREGAHAQAVNTVAIKDAYRRVDDACATQGCLGIHPTHRYPCLHGYASTDSFLKQ